MLTEARYRETWRGWDNAAESYRTLFGFFPDNLEYGLLLARAQRAEEEAKRLWQPWNSLRRLSWSADDARIDVAASEAWASFGDFKQSQLILSGGAEGKSPERGDFLARALYRRDPAWRTSATLPVPCCCRRGRPHLPGARRPLRVASTLEVTGQVLVDRGEHAGALGKFNDEISIARGIGDRKAEASAVNNMANVLGQQGDGEQARKMYEKSSSHLPRDKRPTTTR